MQKKWLGVAVALVVVAAGLGVWGWKTYSRTDRELYALIKDKPELVELYSQAVAAEAKFAANPEDVPAYLAAAAAWKTIGERTPDNQAPFFRKALEIDEKGIEKFGHQNIIFYLNGGKLAERLGEDKKAEGFYLKAIEVSSADESGYLSLVELYRYKLNKSKEEILAIFEMGGAKSMVNVIPLVLARASYLRAIGDYSGALADYKKLSASYPSNAGYKAVILELETAIRNQKK